MINESIREENRIEICGEYDVIVVGGGIAGVSAAIAAARKKSHVLLIEKNVMMGGLATVGYVNKYLPLCDGRGHKVCGGLSEELLWDAIRYGENSLPVVWQTGKGDSHLRYMSEFSPYEFVMVMDEKLAREGVDILYDTVFSMPVMDGESCQAVIVENKEGRSAYRAKAFVDATGDGDLICRAGVEYEIADNWLSSWGYVVSLDRMQEAVEKQRMSAGLYLYELGAKDTGKGGETYPKYDGIDAKSRTAFVIAGRRMICDQMDKETERSRITVAALPHIPQIRKSRRIIGAYEITLKDINQYQSDAIGCAPDWRKRGEVYEIPFPALYSNRVGNIITAGRCISATGDSWEVTRVIPACAVTGQAAGIAAAMLDESHRKWQDINISVLQKLLIGQGAIIHMNDNANTENS